MKGYRKEPAKTAEAIDEDGWLHTGDIVDVDADGYLRVVDRKKELIINAAGKNMSPANIENAILAACPMVGVMITIGDGRPYNAALMVFDADSVGPYAAQHGLSDASPAALAADPEVIARIAAGVAEGNAKLSRVEQIKRFRVLPTLWEPGRRRDHADDEAQAQADHDEIRRRDRRTLRARTTSRRSTSLPTAATVQPA